MEFFLSVAPARCGCGVRVKNVEAKIALRATNDGRHDSLELTCDTCGARGRLDFVLQPIVEH